MKLDFSKWQEFRIGDYFFVTSSKDKNVFNSETGSTPYIAASADNNGITAYVDTPSTQKGNTITIARNGSVGATFYQPYDYCSSPDDIRILTPKFDLNPQIGLFLKTIIEREKFKYTYGRKLGTKRIENLRIKLPAKNNTPDWVYMERYIKTLNHKPISTKVKQKNVPLRPVEKWGEFRVGDLFDVRAGKYYYPDDYAKGITPYITAADTNNGIACRINLDADFKGNVITIGKVGVTTYYQSEDFCATSDVNILTPNFNMNKYVGLFLSTIFNFSEHYKWGYGRQARINDCKNLIIKLPKNPQGFPDWAYMENYIKALPYSDRI